MNVTRAVNEKSIMGQKNVRDILLTETKENPRFLSTSNLNFYNFNVSESLLVLLTNFNMSAEDVI